MPILYCNSGQTVGSPIHYPKENYKITYQPARKKTMSQHEYPAFFFIKLFLLNGISHPVLFNKWAATWDFQQCGMCDQQSLRSACAYTQSDQSHCQSLEYSMSVRLLTKHHLEFLSLKGAVSPNHVVCDVNFWYHRQLNHQQEASPRNFNQS